jgi:ATP-dependent DNA helicase RecG
MINFTNELWDVNTLDDYFDDLDKAGFKTIKDVLENYPTKYREKYKLFNVTKIKQMTINYTEFEKLCFVGTITGFQQDYYSNINSTKITVTVSNNGIDIPCIVWSKKQYYVNYLKTKCQLYSNILVLGNLTYFNSNYQIAQPKFEVYPSNDLDRKELVESYLIHQPKYKVNRNYTTRTFSKAVSLILDQLDYSTITTKLDGLLCDKLSLMKKTDALKAIHFPKSLEESKQARKTLEFEEAYSIQLKFARIKANMPILDELKIDTKNNYVAKILHEINYILSPSQIATYKEISDDFQSGKPMQRLVEGNTGSGKTIISLLAILDVIESGGQVAFIAPTQLLSRQHFNRFSELLQSLPNVNVELVNGTTKATDRRGIIERVRTGETKILVGTHSLFNKSINFNNLKLVIVDEQHKFGLEQRQILRERYNNEIHYLSLSATPIPRTLAMKVYGDLQISHLDDYREIKNINSYIFDLKSGETPYLVYKELLDTLSNGFKALIVVPRVETSEKKKITKDPYITHSVDNTILQKTKMKNCVSVFNEFSNNKEISKYGVGYLHGKMLKVEKDTIIDKFEKGELKVLITTSVIEVGIDIPRLNFMAIYNAESFSTSSMHQLRGRIGRDGSRSKCFFIMSDISDDKALEKVKSVTSNTKGLEIAKADLELRGEGDVLGKKQSGKKSSLKTLKLSDESNVKLLEQAKEYAEQYAISENLLFNRLELPEDDKFDLQQLELVSKTA